MGLRRTFVPETEPEKKEVETPQPEIKINRVKKSEPVKKQEPKTKAKKQVEKTSTKKSQPKEEPVEEVFNGKESIGLSGASPTANAFTKHCKAKGIKISYVLQKLLQGYLNGSISI